MARRAHRWTALALILGALAALLSPMSGPPTAAAAGAPNVVLIVVDTLRADRLASYGHGLPTDAPLRRFLDQATRFDDCRAPASWTAPSTTSLLTGLHPLRHGVVDHDTALAPEAFTLAEALGDRGYTSAGFSHNPNVGPATGLDQGFDHFATHLGGSTAYPDVSAMTAAALGWLDDTAARRVMLYLQPMNVHGPYKVPEAAADDLLGRAPAPGFRYYGAPMRAILKRGAVERRPEVTSAMLTSLREQYDTAVRYSLTEVARFLDELDARGVYDDALIVLTSDHGEEFFEHGGFSHGYSLHDEVLHVPLFIKRPRQREAQVVSAPVSLEDVLPTLIDELALRTPHALDGRSLSPLLDDPTVAEHPAWSDRERVAHVAWPKRCVGQAVERGGLKRVELERDYAGRRDVVEHFDHATDPHELRDLSGRPGVDGEALRALLERRAASWRDAALPVAPRVDADVERAAMEALGYL